MLLCELLSSVRAGEIFHLSSPEVFRPLFDCFNERFKKALKTSTNFSDIFDTLSWEEFSEALNAVIAELDTSQEHYKLFSNILIQNNVNDELVLDISLDKSLRGCLSNRGRKNYGYSIHRDSWFNLSPDGINLAFYLTDVSYNGNTIFFIDFFKTEVPYSIEKRKVFDESLLVKTTSYNCKAGDVLIFSGEHLHGGALSDVSRFSIEFRLSKLVGYGRKYEDISYRPIQYFLPSQ